MGDVETLRELLAAYADVLRRAFELPSPLTPTNRWQELTARFGKPFVGQHIGARVRLLRRCILVSRRMDRREQTALVDEIDRLLPLWPERPLMTLLLTYLSPILAIATPIGRFVAPRLTEVGPDIAYLVLLYALFFAYLPSLAYAATRGLMLGGEGFDAWLPAFIEGRGVYAMEARVFGVLAPPRKEMPLDLILQVAAIVLVAGMLLLFPSVPIFFPALVGLFAAVLTVFSVAAFRTRLRLERW